VLEWIEPSWPAPPQVRALCTTRGGGVSTGPFAGLNLADHVGDEPSLVAQNRALLHARLDLPAEPHWLRQVHGCKVADAVRDPRACRADAVIATGPREVYTVLTTDCLPLLLCDAAGTCVAAVHAGWRGLVKGVSSRRPSPGSRCRPERSCAGWDRLSVRWPSWSEPRCGHVSSRKGAGIPRPRSCRRLETNRGTNGESLCSGP